jgi:hypothetical protein
MAAILVGRFCGHGKLPVPSNGNARASIAWGLALILAVACVLLLCAPAEELLIPIVALIGITGAPYTRRRWVGFGIAGGHFNFYTLLFLLSLVFLIWGFIHFCLLPREELHHMERWVHPVYPMGLISLVIVQWLLAFGAGLALSHRRVVGLYHGGYSCRIGLLLQQSMRKNRINGVTPPFWLELYSDG